jgi:hypothetical protein
MRYVPLSEAIRNVSPDLALVRRVLLKFVYNIQVICGTVTSRVPVR